MPPDRHEEGVGYDSGLRGIPDTHCLMMIQCPACIRALHQCVIDYLVLRHLIVGISLCNYFIACCKTVQLSKTNLEKDHSPRQHHSFLLSMFANLSRQLFKTNSG